MELEISNGKKEVGGGYFEARCQAPHVFHPAEEALDDVSPGIEAGIVGNGLAGIAL